MTELQAWFAPLLWVIGTITAIVAFVKLIMPAIKALGQPAKLQESFNEFSTNITTKWDKLDGRLDKIDSELDSLIEKIHREEEIELALLHDAIVQIYHFSKSQGKVYPEDYQRACELYKYNGKSQYVETIMEELTELYRRSMGTEEKG